MAVYMQVFHTMTHYEWLSITYYNHAEYKESMQVHTSIQQQFAMVIGAHCGTMLKLN